MTSDRASEVAFTALELAREHRFGEVAQLFAEQLRALVVPATLAAAWEAELANQGTITTVGEPVVEPTGGEATMVKLPITCAHGAFTLLAVVGADGRLQGLQLAPIAASAPISEWQPPAYVVPGSFAEQEVTLGAGPLAVGATVSVPHGSGPWPGVVLLAGSGPLDRDETIGRNRPLKDVAWGLASRGVAVLRFDKVTHAHADRIRGRHDFTLADEYVPHAVAAVEHLRALPDVDRQRVFLLGHSLGGTVAPRVASAAPDVAGIVLLAAGAQPLHWVIVRQARYLASLNPETEAQAQPAIEALAAKARAVDGPDLSLDTPADRLPLGAPAGYWLDLRDYDPAAVAATLDCPILILQGGRDYQVTVEDDLARWQAALTGCADVTVRVYPAHNHLFTPGSGPCTPAEYEPAQHVDGTVIADVADWLSAHGGA